MGKAQFLVSIKINSQNVDFSIINLKENKQLDTKSAWPVKSSEQSVHLWI